MPVRVLRHAGRSAAPAPAPAVLDRRHVLLLKGVTAGAGSGVRRARTGPGCRVRKSGHRLRTSFLARSCAALIALSSGLLPDMHRRVGVVEDVLQRGGVLRHRVLRLRVVGREGELRQLVGRHALEREEVLRHRPVSAGVMPICASFFAPCSPAA